MIIASYHDFWSLLQAICPVCPTQTRDITSSGRPRTGHAGMVQIANGALSPSGTKFATHFRHS